MFPTMVKSPYAVPISFTFTSFLTDYPLSTVPRRMRKPHPSTSFLGNRRPRNVHSTGQPLLKLVYYWSIWMQLRRKRYGPVPSLTRHI